MLCHQAGAAALGRGWAGESASPHKTPIRYPRICPMLKKCQSLAAVWRALTRRLAKYRSWMPPWARVEPANNRGRPPPGWWSRLVRSLCLFLLGLILDVVGASLWEKTVSEHRFSDIVIEWSWEINVSLEASITVDIFTEPASLDTSQDREIHTTYGPSRHPRDVSPGPSVPCIDAPAGLLPLDMRLQNSGQHLQIPPYPPDYAPSALRYRPLWLRPCGDYGLLWRSSQAQLAVLWPRLNGPRS